MRCIWHGDDQPVALLSLIEAQVALIAAFSSSVLFGQIVLAFLLTIPHRFSVKIPNKPILFQNMFCSSPVTEFRGLNVTASFGLDVKPRS